MEVCPTDIIHAPAERIWQLLVDAQELARWTGTKLFKGPLRPLRTGDLVVLGAGFMHFSFEFLDEQAPQSLRFLVRLPFGIVNHEHVQITPAGSDSCRVTFN